MATLAASACATPAPVTLDLYRGVYSTHFDGVPDRAELCALLTNRASHSVDWVTLRLRAYPTYGERTARWTSYWTYREHFRPGESRTVRLIRPPVADQVELEVRDAGWGPSPASGRPVVDAESCSEPSLHRDVRANQEGRTAPGMSVYPVIRRNDPESEVVVAQDR
jgi:hypothetical protein